MMGNSDNQGFRGQNFENHVVGKLANAGATESRITGDRFNQGKPLWGGAYMG